MGHLSGNKLFNDDFFEVVGEIEEGTVDLLLADPPYFQVLDDDWDNQWKNEDDFLSFISLFLQKVKPLLSNRASCFLFCFPSKAAETELLIKKEGYSILNTLIWKKSNFNGFSESMSRRTKKQVQRRFFYETERIIFFEKPPAFIYSSIVDYLKNEWTSAGLLRKHLKEALGNFMGVHYFSESQFQFLPERAYEKVKSYARVYKGDAFSKDYSLLKAEYDSLSFLKRRFKVGSQNTDLLQFVPEKGKSRYHPAQKPLSLFEYLIETTTEVGDLVLDPFMGSGTAWIAARNTGRRFIGVEKDPKIFLTAVEREREISLQGSIL